MDVSVHFVAFTVLYAQKTVSVGVDFEETFANLVGFFLGTVFVKSRRTFLISAAELSVAETFFAFGHFRFDSVFLFGRNTNGSRDFVVLFRTTAARCFGGRHFSRRNFQNKVDKFCFVFLGRRRNAHFFGDVADCENACVFKHFPGVI